MRSRLLENGSVKTDLCKDNRGDGDLQSLWPASSDMFRLVNCCCIAVIACGIGLFHMAHASRRLTSVHVNTSQNNSGCEVLQRVYRTAERSHMLKMCICVHPPVGYSGSLSAKRNVQEDQGHFTKKSMYVLQDTRTITGPPVLVMNSQLWFADSLTSTLLDWCGQSTALLLGFQKDTGLTVLTFQHVNLTQLRDGDLSLTGLVVLD